MDEFWLTMVATYGHKWTSTYDAAATNADGHLTAAAKMWRFALNKLSDAQIRRGLESVINRSDPWPPSLPEFVALCRPPAAWDGAKHGQRWDDPDIQRALENSRLSFQPPALPGPETAVLRTGRDFTQHMLAKLRRGRAGASDAGEATPAEGEGEKAGQGGSQDAGEGS